MACSSKNRIQKKIAFRRKLHILRTLTNSNSVKTSSIIKDAFLYISALKLKLEALKRENMSLVTNHFNQLPVLEVNVEKLEKKGFRLWIRSQKRGDNLVCVLQAFEEMGIEVIQAKVSCNIHFVMEAIVEVSNSISDFGNDNVNDVDVQQVLDPSVLTQAILKAMERSDYCC